MKIGYKLTAEGFGPKELVRQAVRAEQAGFDFVEISDHYHPWLHSQGHSPFAWGVLAAIAERTERIELGPGVTCPFLRYHPAIIAQAAATLSLLSDGRFFLPLGAGERLNEHVVGLGWPAVSVRHRMFREAIDIIRLLWQGGYQSYDGEYLTLEDARVWDLPETLPPIIVAISGPASAAVAVDKGDGIFGTEPKPEVVKAYRDAGGTGPAYTEVPLAWAPDAESAATFAWESSRFGLTGWKVMAELPNPVNFEAATQFITPDDVAEQMACGPDPERHLEVAQEFLDAGYEHLTLMALSEDNEGWFRFYEAELADRLRALS